MKILVAGSGGWGTALALLLHKNGHEVTLWSYCAEESERLAQTLENPFLPGVALPKALRFIRKKSSSPIPSLPRTSACRMSRSRITSGLWLSPEHSSMAQPSMVSKPPPKEVSMMPS